MKTPTGEVRAELGRHVRDLRTARGISQEEVARRMTKLGLPIRQVTFARLEAGTRPTPLEELIVLAQVLDVPVSALLPVQSGADSGPTESMRALGTAVRETLSLIDAARVTLHSATPDLATITGLPEGSGHNAPRAMRCIVRRREPSFT